MPVHFDLWPFTSDLTYDMCGQIFQRICVILGYVLTCGLLWLFLHWYQNYKIKMMYRKCSPNSADCLLISNLKFKQHYVVKPKFLSSKVVGKYYSDAVFGDRTELVTFNFMERKFFLRVKVFLIQNKNSHNPIDCISHDQVNQYLFPGR